MPSIVVTSFTSAVSSQPPSPAMASEIMPSAPPSTSQPTSSTHPMITRAKDEVLSVSVRRSKHPIVSAQLEYQNRCLMTDWRSCISCVWVTLTRYGMKYFHTPELKTIYVTFLEKFWTGGLNSTIEDLSGRTEIHTPKNLEKEDESHETRKNIQNDTGMSNLLISTQGRSFNAKSSTMKTRGEIEEVEEAELG
ncbi:hypothetical protein F0562_011001 [Nyssa sinensis]|uniref:Uncharacterized protein n=1 Tax=Nyssa sinensis TaxID=561372 RepID=A0A5J5A3K7_9ASTE|nr:hypothetical protein F0562_011001 [Nyssa sinensis]